MTASLRKRLHSATFWSFTRSVGVYGIRFAVSIALARILAPRDFGLIGMLAVFGAVAEVIIDAGFTPALIRKRNPTPEDYSTVFIFNLVVGLLLFILLWISAPYVARFYDEPILALILPISSLKLLIGAFSSVHHVVLHRELNVRPVTVASLVSITGAGAIAIAAAAGGMGVWAIVLYSLAERAIRAVMILLYMRWLPRPRFYWSAFRELRRIGNQMLLQGTLGAGFRNAHSLVIGKALSADALGFFTRASALKDMPLRALVDPLASLLFPTFALVQDDLPRVQSLYRRSVIAILFITTPAMFLLMLSGTPLIMALLGEKWLPTVPLLQVFCLIGVIEAVSRTGNGVLAALDRLPLSIRLQTGVQTASVLALAFSYRHGAHVILIVELFVLSGGLLIRQVAIGRAVGFTLADQFRAFLPYPLLSGVTMTGAYLITRIMPLEPLLVIHRVFVFGLLYLGLAILTQSEGYHLARELLEDRLRRIRELRDPKR